MTNEALKIELNSYYLIEEVIGIDGKEKLVSVAKSRIHRRCPLP